MAAARSLEEDSPVLDAPVITGRTVIVKLAERCNLACPYCYMYSGPDQSWRERPRRLGEEQIALLVERAAELLEDPYIRLTLEFHGGEPLLFGRERFAKMIARFRARLPDQRVIYCLQTNGVLLDAAWCDLLSANRVHWSISCDGPAEVHDRYRFKHNGRGTHAAVEAAIRLSQSRPEWRRWSGGVLAVIDASRDGGEIVRYFERLGVTHLDLLMPDVTRAAPDCHVPGFDQRMLARFMGEAFDAWVALDNPRFHLRCFEHIAKGFFGLPPEVDAYGGGLDWLTVVESDGGYQLLDVLHTCGEAFTTIGGSLASRSLAEQYAAQAAAAVAPCATCRACPVFDLCGGGYLPHRFDGAGFDNPSVHCEAIKATIARVEGFLHTHLPAAAWVEPPAGKRSGAGPDAPGGKGVFPGTSDPGAGAPRRAGLAHRPPPP